jgi:flavin-dependent thymidylate synthase
MSDSQEVSTWVDKAMYEAAPMESTMPKVFLISSTPDPLGAIAAACRMYEGKPTYSLRDITMQERVHYWEEVQKTHLKAPLEFVQLHFFIEGVTRAFTHQMVRQRTAVYAQESLRFAVKTDMADEVQMPPSLRSLKDDDPRVVLWNNSMETIGKVYNSLVDSGVPAEDARGVLPHAVTTRLNYATNLRNLLDHAGNRLCTQAQFEWRYVFLEIMRVLRDTETQPYNQEDWPSQWRIITDSRYAAFAPVCYAQGKCPFKAGFDRGCTIRERVDAGRFDEIDPREWMSDPTAGWVR